MVPKLRALSRGDIMLVRQMYIVTPGEAKVGGFNVNSFKDAQAAYYKCANLPPWAS